MRRETKEKGPSGSVFQQEAKLRAGIGALEWKER